MLLKKICTRSVNIVAFTLIELLVVMAIIATMGSMILALVGSTGDSADRTDTQALIYVVGSSIQLYVHENSAVPLPTGSSTDPGSGSWYPDSNDGSWSKQQLWWRLNHEMTTVERVAMSDAGKAADLAGNPYQSMDYQNSLNSNNSARCAKIREIFSAVSDVEMERYKNIDHYDWVKTYGDVNDTATNISNRGKYKIHYLKILGDVAKDLAQRTHHTYPCLDVDEIDTSRFVDDQTIIDAWGEPLIYIAHSTVPVT